MTLSSAASSSAGEAGWYARRFRGLEMHRPSQAEGSSGSESRIARYVKS